MERYEDRPAAGRATTAREVAREIGGGNHALARVTPVREAFEVQDKCIVSLHELIEEIERRLDPVLAPGVPQPGSPEKPMRSEVQIVRTIETHTMQIAVSRDRLRAILDRIAV